MNDKPSAKAGFPWLSLPICAVFLVGGAVAAGFFSSRPPVEATEPPPPIPPPARKQERAALGEELQQLCTACHVYASPESFPRWAWKKEIMQAYNFIATLRPDLATPPIQEVIEYFENRAPLDFPKPQVVRSKEPYPVRLEMHETPACVHAPQNSITNVQPVHLTDEKNLELLACDGRVGQILLLRPRDPEPKWRVLGEVSNPARAEVVDLDGDGIKDLLVANLGSFPPTDDLHGSVVWLRGKGDGTFAPPVTLIGGLGRVADVRAAKFFGTKKLDLIVASFGYLKAGEVVLLENRTGDWSKPEFKKHVVDKRHGAIHVPVADLNGDDKPDFVCLFAQEHERVEAFINEGGGKFRRELIYAAPEPGFGSSGIQLVDLDGDGKVDILYTNGDILDRPHLMKPYHGVRWLRNEGKYPYTHHLITPLYGVHSAVAADLKGEGKLDIIAVAFLPEFAFPNRKDIEADSVLLLEQTSPGKFQRHTIQKSQCDHVTCCAADLYGTGKKDVIVGNFGTSGNSSPVTIWKNLGTVKPQEKK